MELMTWSESLAETAMLWAKRCVWEHGFPTLITPDGKTTTRYGQNLYVQSWDDEISMTYAIQAWYDEEAYYDYDTMHCCKEPCGHYTQAMWATNSRVGCAYYHCHGLASLDPKKFSSALYLVCNYLPGQVAGRKPFKKGPACSQCASGAAWCSDGLCNDACTAAGDGCACAAHCHNCATLDETTCRCECAAGWAGSDCTQPCIDHDMCGFKQYGKPFWPRRYCKLPSKYAKVVEMCWAMCGRCKPDPDVKAGQCPPIYGRAANRTKSSALVGLPKTAKGDTSAAESTTINKVMILTMILSIWSSASL